MNNKKLLTVGMATYDDIDGVYFSIQSLRLHHPEVMDHIEFVVVDNNPQSNQGQAVAKFVTDFVPSAQYVPHTDKIGTSTRNRLFEVARTPYMLVMDCHVLLEAGSLQRLIEYYQQHPDTTDLLHGPLIHEAILPEKLSTHMEPVWNEQMFGKWGLDPRGQDRDAAPFEIPMHGMGLYSCRTNAWLRFNDLFRGFGGEEGYIHDKFRREGRRVMCLPFLRWLHRFVRPAGAPYPMKLHERVNNYLIGSLELGQDPSHVLDHFQQWGGRARWEQLLQHLQKSNRAATTGEPAQATLQNQNASHSSETPHRMADRPTGDTPVTDEPPSLPAKEVLWTDTTLFDARYEKSAKALVAVQQTLWRCRPLEGGEKEFLDIYARFVAADPEAFTDVWTSPVAYFWTRIAYQLVKCCVASEPLPPVTQLYVSAIHAKGPHDALAWHLDQFKMFALALAIRQDQDWLFENPWEPLLPAAIPGTPWSFSGDRSVSLHGIEQGQLRASDESGTFLIPLDEASDFSSPQIRRHCCPTITYEDCQLFAQPYAFHIPSLSDTDDVLHAGVEFQHEQRLILRKTLETMKRYDLETFQQFSDVMSLIALKRPEMASTSNTSFSRLPGALTTTATQNRLALAEDFIHEYYHNRLFSIEEQGSFFEDDGGKSITDTRFYSPWRCDQRPLYGVWHATYVFTAVCRYWLSVYQDPPVDAESNQYALGRLLQVSHQLAMGSHVLKCHATFSPFGQRLFEELASDVETLRDQINLAGVPLDVPALEANSEGGYTQQRSEIDQRPLSVREALREHCQLYDIKGQCLDLEQTLLQPI